MNENNLVPHESAISRADRCRLFGHHPVIVWMTGLSGSGKSTLANALEKKLYQMRAATYILDGDNVRLGLNQDLGFSPSDRQENIRRIGETAKLFLDSGSIVITAFISPFENDRQLVRGLVGPEEFIEVYIKCSLNLCEQRDPKGLYKKARSGEIKDFTGISSPYEEPVNPEIVVDTSKETVDQAVDKILEYLKKRELFTIVDQT